MQLIDLAIKLIEKDIAEVNKLKLLWKKYYGQRKAN